MNSLNGPSPVLSVITPVTEMMGKLQRLARWVGKADSLGIEVIIIHDYRDHGTQRELTKILESLRNTTIKMVEGKFGSPGLARNAGLSLATGDWVAFWDSDDVPELEVALDSVQKHQKSQYECLVFNFDLIDERTDESRFMRLSNDPILDMAFTPGIWRFIFKKTSIEGLLFESIRIGEDQLFIAQYDLERRKVLYLENKVYNYYFGADGHQTNNTLAKGDILKLIRKTSNLLVLKSGCRRFLELQFARQVFTGVKMLNFKISTLSILQTARLFLILKPSRSIKLLKSFYRIFKLSRRSF